MLDPKAEANKKCGPGKFPCRIMNLKRDFSKTNKTEYWELSVEVLEGQFAGAGVTDNVYFKATTYEEEKKALKKAAQFLLDCGYDQPIDLDSGEALWDALVGKTIGCAFKEEEEEWVGKDGKPRTTTKTRFEPFGFFAVDKTKYPDTPAGETGARGAQAAGDTPDDSDALPFG